MNTYKKFCPNVFIALCDEKHEKGEEIILITKRGKENKHIVFNLVGYAGTKESPRYCYSIIRSDGYNVQEHAKKKAEKLQGYASNAEQRSTDFYEASKEGADFLSLGEPIKIGHHSENRHRKLIQRNWDRMGKSVSESEKAEEYKRRADYWERRTDVINLSMPESLEYFEYKLHEAKTYHQYLKDNPSKRAHSYSLTYANKAVKEMDKNLKLAVKLWGSNEEIEQINKEETEKAKIKASKKTGFEDLLLKHGGFFFFGSDMKSFKEKYNQLLTDGYIDEGEKVTHIVAGLYVPVKCKDIFISKL